MKKIRIGVVDDNRDFCDVVTDYLVKQSNACQENQSAQRQYNRQLRR